MRRVRLLSFSQTVAFTEAKLTEARELRFLDKFKNDEHNAMAIDVRTRIIYHAEGFRDAERTEEASALPESPRRQLVEDS